MLQVVNVYYIVYYIEVALHLQYDASDIETIKLNALDEIVLVSSWQVLALVKLKFQQIEFSGILEVQYDPLVVLVLVSNIFCVAGMSLKFYKTQEF